MADARIAAIEVEIVAIPTNVAAQITTIEVEVVGRLVPPEPPHIGPVGVLYAPLLSTQFFLPHIGPVGVLHPVSILETEMRLAREAVVVAHQFPAADTEMRLARQGVVVAKSRVHGWDIYLDPADTVRPL